MGSRATAECRLLVALPARGRAPWLVPTARAVPWRPLAAVVVALAGVLTTAHAVGAAPPPPLLVGVALALLVAAALLGLDDPARDLLAAVPTTLARRRAHRLALLTPVLASAAAGLLVGGQRLDLLLEPLRSTSASLMALVAVGLLAARLAELWRPELTAPIGAAAPVTWVLAAAALPDTGPVATLAHGWLEHPWPCTAAAAMAWGAAERLARP